MENGDYSSHIAIIGMSGRFPGARSLSEFWDNLCQGKESISFFSDQELIAAGISPETLNQPNYVKAKAILEDVDLFDAEFFGFSPREAEALDPQQRLFLECAWEALENAGYYSENKAGKIGVYAGSGMNDYYYFHLLKNSEFKNKVGSFQLMISNMPDTLCTRVSYEFNLTGPSYTIQTACSSSLVASAVACQGLLNFQCDLALAGGVSLHLPIKTGYLYKEGMILSQDGHCRPFDQKADGTVPGMGCGVVILKRLEDALKDKDSIYAVIKGFAINNDGSNKIGYTAPSVDGQISVISEAQGMANVNPETISYIEAHGTGTKLGDPIEIMALTKAFRESTDKKQFCSLGSLKSNLGHLDAAAGVAGLIKTTLALHHRLLPPTLHFQQSNPHIHFDDSPFYVQTELTSWQSTSVRRAGVSSFGIGGTNAHMILEEAPVNQRPREDREWHLLILSAKTSDTLVTLTHNLFNFLKENPTLSLSDVAYTLAVGRTPFQYRRMFIINNKESLLHQQDIAFNDSTNETVDLKDKDFGKDISHILSAHHQDLLDEQYLQLCQTILQKSTEHGMNLSDIVAQKDLFNKEDFLSLLGELWLKGVEIEWDLVYSAQKLGRVNLPSYPFQRKRYWIESDIQLKNDLKSSSCNDSIPLPPNDLSIFDDTEQILLEIWQKQLGIEKINIHDNFFVLGGESLQALDILEKIKSKFGIGLELKTIMEYPSIAQLKDLVARKIMALKSYLPDKKSLSIITKLKLGTTSESLFLIHPITGYVLCYRELANAIEGNMPIYGIQADYITSSPEVISLTSIEEIASYYLQAMRDVQPTGPYWLLGYSFGGLVAFEMAQQLKASGESIALLAMLDTINPADCSLSTEAAEAINNLGLQELPLSYQQKCFKQIKLHSEASRIYRPKNYDGRIVFFEAKEKLYTGTDRSPALSWKNLAKGNVEIYEVPGNHFTMIKSPHVNVISEKLNLLLER